MDRFLEQEVGHAHGNVVRPEQLAAFFLNRASTSALDQRLSLDDPARSSSDDLRLARRYCGRWLAVRRLNVGLSNGLIAERTGVDAQTLLALELGLSEVQPVADDAVDRLCQMLAASPPDADFIAAV